MVSSPWPIIKSNDTKGLFVLNELQGPWHPATGGCGGGVHPQLNTGAAAKLSEIMYVVSAPADK